MAHSSPSETILHQGTTLRGRLTGEGDTRVYGVIQGEVVLRGTLTVGEGGAVRGGVVEATTIHVEGELTGEVHASHGLVVFPSGTLRGRIHGGTLRVHAGATLACHFDCEFELPEVLWDAPPRH
ncbi:MAG: polymer-forming cytoskeletal protein [Myxococcales bacterium]|nr:polymer-forming cytoskeletal protein [Polyangiaceae bacterium]MDW8250299.1 polymer-forming cytoskeletal protein [Myxococcales bacterium]